jgi:hypothetical protein
MKNFVFLIALFALGIILQTAALADEKLEQYCIESGDGGGGSTVSCTFETMAQCLASKGGPSDKCYKNPRIK